MTKFKNNESYYIIGDDFVYFARTEVVLSEDILNFNIKIEEYVDVDEKIYFLFQPIIYFYVFNGELVAYGGNI